MKKKNRHLARSIFTTLFMAFFLALQATPTLAGGYDNALKGVKGLKTVFSVSQGDPAVSNIIFWTVKDAYQDKTVVSLPEKPLVAVVFHGPAVKLLTTDKAGFDKKVYGEIDKFQNTLREMKKDGVKLEACGYAIKVMGVNPATIIPEIDVVGNGFISVSGYQAQGYSVVSIK